MSVTLSRPYAGFASGATVTLPDDTEAALIAQGRAVAAVTDTVGMIPLMLVRDANGVLGVLDQVTGAVIPFAELTAAITGGTINGATIGAVTPASGAFTTLAASGAFGANGAAAQTKATVGAALNTFAAGTHGLSSDADMTALLNQVIAMRAALVANGIATT